MHSAHLIYLRVFDCNVHGEGKGASGLYQREVTDPPVGLKCSACVGDGCYSTGVFACWKIVRTTSNNATSRLVGATKHGAKKMTRHD